MNRNQCRTRYVDILDWKCRHIQLFFIFLCFFIWYFPCFEWWFPFDLCLLWVSGWLLINFRLSVCTFPLLLDFFPIFWQTNPAVFISPPKPFSIFSDGPLLETDWNSQNIRNLAISFWVFCTPLGTLIHSEWNPTPPLTIAAITLFSVN